MPQKQESQAGQPRRRFLAGLLAGVGATAAVLSGSKRARAAAQMPTVPVQGPILYRRTAEAERYYKTLYQ